MAQLRSNEDATFQPSNIISLAALAISFLSLFVTIRSYVLSNRPYVGVISMEHKILGSPPNRMTWSSVIKNVGEKPASLSVKQNRTHVSGKSQALDSNLALVADRLMLFPGQEGRLDGSISDKSEQAALKVADVVNGNAKLEVYITLEYSSKGLIFGESKYGYESVHFFSPKDSAFLQTFGKAD
jgi:hypothetical protein